MSIILLYRCIVSPMIDPYARTILLELWEKNSLRFTELQRTVKNPRTLAGKLAALHGLGLVELHGGIYRPTEKGLRAARVLKELTEIIGETLPETGVPRVPHPCYGPLLSRYTEMLRDHFGSRLAGVLLFGSVARGDWNKDSDIDLLTVVDDWQGPPWARTQELWTLKMRLMESDEYNAAEARGFAPTLQHYPLSTREAVEFHHVYLDASLDGVVLYEKNGFLSSLLDNVRKRLSSQGAFRVTLPESRSHYWVLTGEEGGTGRTWNVAR